MIYYLTSITCYLYFKIFHSLKLTGLENIPKDGAFIIASNHVSYMDPIIIGAVIGGFLRQKITFLAKEELFRNRFWKWYLRKLNIFPLKRESSDSGAMRGAIRRLKEGIGLLIFPEGTRSKDGELKEGRIGISVLSYITKTPIIPCYVGGTYQVLPSGSKSFNKGRVSISFGKSIQHLVLDGVEKKKKYFEFAQKIMANIKLLKDNLDSG